MAIYFVLNKKLNYKTFDTSNIEIKIQQTSNDTYLKAIKLESLIINSNDLQKTFKFILSNENSSIETNFINF